MPRGVWLDPYFCRHLPIPRFSAELPPQEFTWFFALFHHEFRQGNLIAFEVLMT
jgi:hypothetical protein